jgi:hypothetical protein
MNVAICSLFRDSASTPELARFVRQVNALDWPPDAWRVYAVEGDSTDRTWTELCGWSMDDSRVLPFQMAQNTPPFRSVEDPVRLRALSELLAGCVGMALADDWADAVLWVESDLIWRPDLLRRLTRHNADAIAPWVYVHLNGHGETSPGRLCGLGGDGRVFYDTWAFRNHNGSRFSQYEMPPIDGKPFPVASAGSCLLMARKAAEVAAEPSDLAIVGSCQYIREAGMKIMVDPSTFIWHPWPRGT